MKICNYGIILWMVEFIGEGMGRRRTDLIRWNKFVTGTFSANNLLEQNPGY